MTTKPAPTCCSRFQKFLTILFYLAGIALSGYAYFVEYQLENEPGKYINTIFSFTKPKSPSLRVCEILLINLIFRI